MNNKSRQINRLGIGISFLGLLFLAIFIPLRAHAAIDLDFMKSVEIVPIYKTLNSTDGTGMGASIKSIWGNILNLVNGLVVVMLIMVAFAQILRINLNTYGVKKILPTLILAIIAANFSYLFCRLIVDFANIIMSYLVDASQGGKITNIMNGGTDITGWASRNNPTFASLDSDWGTVFWFLMMQLLLLASGVMIYILDFLFFARIWIIYFLVPIAPLAFMALPLPQTKSYFGQWWGLLSKWAFMPVVSLFWIWLGSKWIGSVGGSFLLQLVFGGFCFYMAIKSPFSLGGAVMSGWAKYGKQAGKWGLDRSGATGGYDYLKKKGQLNMESRKQGVYNVIKDRTKIGTGLDAANAKNKRVKDASARISNRAEVKANSSRAAQKQIQYNANIDARAKEIEEEGKSRFMGSNKGRAMTLDQTRSETRAAATAKKTEAILADVKQKYYDNANPDTENGVNEKMKAEIIGYLKANSDSVIATAKVEKSQKILDEKMLMDRMAYDNAMKPLIDAENKLAKAIKDGDATKKTEAEESIAAAQLVVDALDEQIKNGTSWATKKHEKLDSAARSRMQAKTDQMLQEEASIDLEKDGDSIAKEMFEDEKFHEMLAQRPHNTLKTQDKIDYLAKNKAVDKIMASRTGGKASVEAQAMANRLLTKLQSTEVNMDPATQAKLVGDIVKNYNASHPEETISASNFEQIQTQLKAAQEMAKKGNSKDAKAGEAKTMALLTAMRSQLTQPRASAKA